MRRIALAGMAWLAASLVLTAQPRPRPPVVHGHNHRVRVFAPSRLDAAFALGGAAAPADQTLTYYLYVPPTYRHNRPHPAVLFLSARAVPDEHAGWEIVCRKYGALFALVPGGNDVPAARRMRFAVDVFDDLRRRMNLDTDRVYVGGFSEGARTACELAFAYPEFVGGVVAVGAAASPRPEPYLRDRLRERLSVALIAGEVDPGRGEVQRYRLPALEGARARLWLVPRGGHAMPPAAVLQEAFLWLDAARPVRLALGLKYPTSRVSAGVVPEPDVWARGVVQEARLRLKEAVLKESAQLQLAGVVQRWPDTAAAAEAKKLLGADGRRLYNQRQQEDYHREAAALDAYLAGPLPPRDQLHRTRWLRLSERLWMEVERYGPDTKHGQEAAKRLAELRKRLAGR